MLHFNFSVGLEMKILRMIKKEFCLEFKDCRVDDAKSFKSFVQVNEEIGRIYILMPFLW